MIGHLGVGSSDGMLHDFAGSYYIRKHPNNLAFGSVTKSVFCFVVVQVSNIKIFVVGLYW